MKVLHVLESSIPDTGGYTIRAQSIIEHQRRIGLDPVVITSPLFRPKGITHIPPVETFNGIRHYRTNHIPSPAVVKSTLARYLTRVAMMRRYRAAVMEVVSNERPQVIHAHSSYLNPYAALPAARRFGIPLVYEVRTLWGESAVVEDGWRQSSWKYRTIWRMELAAMRSADAVVPIAQGIRDELASRGIDPAKITIVPNGVDIERFAARPPDQALAARHGLAGKFVVGFIGSMRRLEGLGTLVEAYAQCRQVRDDMRLVLVGDGPDRAAAQDLAQRLGASDVLFTGNVPHDEVLSWYSIMDVLAYPRIRATINERVTPLKPLEAMALGKVCVGSDVGGLKELIRDGETGIIVPSENPQELARALMRLADDRSWHAKLAAAALAYVRNERDWRSLIGRTRALYESLMREPRVAR